MLEVTGPDPTLHARVRDLFAAGATVVVCDVRALSEPDPATIDGLLHLALTARRCGGHLRLMNTSTSLGDFLACTGLGAVLDVEDRAP